MLTAKGQSRKIVYLEREGIVPKDIKYDRPFKGIVVQYVLLGNIILDHIRVLWENDEIASARILS